MDMFTPPEMIIKEKLASLHAKCGRYARQIDFPLYAVKTNIGLPKYIIKLILLDKLPQSKMLLINLHVRINKIIINGNWIELITFLMIYLNLNKVTAKKVEPQYSEYKKKLITIYENTHELWCSVSKPIINDLTNRYPIDKHH